MSLERKRNFAISLALSFALPLHHLACVLREARSIHIKGLPRRGKVNQQESYKWLYCCSETFQKILHMPQKTHTTKRTHKKNKVGRQNISHAPVPNLSLPSNSGSMVDRQQRSSASASTRPHYPNPAVEPPHPPPPTPPPLPETLPGFRHTQGDAVTWQMLHFLDRNTAAAASNEGSGISLTHRKNKRKKEKPTSGSGLRNTSRGV